MTNDKPSAPSATFSDALAVPAAVSHGESSPVWSEAERRIGALLQAAWSNAEKSHGVTLYPTSYEATFRDMARAVLQDLATPAAIVAELDKAKDELSRLHALVAAHEAEKAQGAALPAAQCDDLVLVRRDLLGSACYALRTRRPAPKTLEALRAAAMQDAAPAAPVAARTDFLLGGARFKVASDRRQQDARIYGLPRELGGRWVALVAAEDDQHLSPAPAAPAPAAAPNDWLLPADLTAGHVRFRAGVHCSALVARMDALRRATLADAPVAVPLTDEEMWEALLQCPRGAVESLRVRWVHAQSFARAIERTLAARWGIKLEGGGNG